MPIVYTKFQPTIALDVSDAEAASLRAQGLLDEDENGMRSAIATGHIGPGVTLREGEEGVATNPADGIVIMPIPAKPKAATASALQDTPDPEGADTKKGNKAP